MFKKFAIKAKAKKLRNRMKKVMGLKQFLSIVENSAEKRNRGRRSLRKKKVSFTVFHTSELVRRTIQAWTRPDGEMINIDFSDDFLKCLLVSCAMYFEEKYLSDDVVEDEEDMTSLEAELGSGGVVRMTAKNNVYFLTKQFDSMAHF